MTKLIMISIVCLSLAVSNSVFAGGVSGTSELPPFEVMDKDGDGFISREEAVAIPGFLDVFDSIVQDDSGRLSKDIYEGIRSGETREPTTQPPM